MVEWGWCYVCVRWESGYSVLMAGPGICVLCLEDTCASEVHPVFKPVAPYGYLLPNMYLFTTDIAHPASFVCCCFTWISLDITRVCEQQRPPSSGPAWPACPPKTVNRSPIAGAGEFDTICTAVCVTDVTAPPLVGCVVWSQFDCHRFGHSSGT